jgi:hypothetical protein
LPSSLRNLSENRVKTGGHCLMFISKCAVLGCSIILHKGLWEDEIILISCMILKLHEVRKKRPSLLSIRTIQNAWLKVKFIIHGPFAHQRGPTKNSMINLI